MGFIEPTFAAVEYWLIIEKKALVKIVERGAAPR
jgi:hypothetical protein